MGCISEKEEGGHTMGAGRALRSQARVTLALDEARSRGFPQDSQSPGWAWTTL